MLYVIKVINPKGVVSQVTIEAASQIDAEKIASLSGYSVLSISKTDLSWKTWLNRKPTFDTLLFSQELVALLHSGLNLVACIETLADKTSEANSKQLLEKVLNALHEGQTFSDAVATQPEIFPALFVALIRASEKTGDLKHAVQRYVTYRTQIELVRSKLITASIYPVLLLTVGLLVSIFLLGYVVPKFSGIYGDVGENIPWMSRALIQWGNLLHANGLEVILATLGITILLIFFFRQKSIKAKLNHWIWSIPSLGEKLRLYLLARFYRTLGMLLQGGIPLVTAMDMSANLLGTNLNQQLELAIQKVKEGMPLSFALDQHGLMTAVSKRMISVGEQTGNLGEMMENAASFYDHEITRWVDWLTRLIEPILMMIIGLMIGGIVVLMYLPIFELADSIQ